MRRQTLIALLFVLALSGQAWAQVSPKIVWQTCLGGEAADEVGWSVIQTSDGGYATVGTTQSNGGEVTGHHGGDDIWVVKTDAGGVFQWQKCLGGSGTDFGNSIIQTTDGGYAIAGETFSSDGDVTGGGYHGGGDLWVVKLDPTGSTIQWQKCYGGTGEDIANSIIQTSDGGFAVAGSTSSNNNGDVTGNHGGADDFWVLKLSGTGTLQWQYCYGGTLDEAAQSIIQTSDGGFAVAGYTGSTNGDVTGDHGSDDFWVLKLSSSGALRWEKCLGGTGTDRAYSIVQMATGDFVVAGLTGSFDGDVFGNHGGSFDAWVVRLDQSGTTIQWQKCFGGTNSDRAYGITKTTDSGFAIAGLTTSNDDDVSGNFDPQNGLEWIVKINDTGGIQWQKCLGGNGGEQGNSIIQIPNGNYVVAGTTASNDSDVSGNHGGEDFWVVELSVPPQPIINYITPDAGAPGMCVAVEIMGPDTDQENFGSTDQFYAPPITIVSLTRPSDAALVKLGPCVVSWNGRMIQQMFMIEPHVGPIDTEIYFVVTSGGVSSAVDSFRIVTPKLASGGIVQNGGGVLQTNGRTVRNTLIVDSLILTNGTYTYPATDPDPNTPGNQSYLPLRILSLGPIRITNATLSADGASGTTGSSGGNGGPGGGGGGSGYPGKGGDGFTGGGGDNDGSNGPGGNGCGYTISSHAYDGIGSLTGVVGGSGEQHSGFSGDDGGGGGTGHPFGTSGVYGTGGASPLGGYGGASAGGSSGPPSYTTNYGGGGGGNEAPGLNGVGSSGANGGQTVGNPMLVPLFGGSGGGAGNQTYVSFLGSSKGGCGGGGGGAIDLTSFAKLEVLNGAISAQGGNGSNAVPIESAAGGGGGSGGAISIDARDSITIDQTSTFNVAGGLAGTSPDNNGGKGGVGRIRISGFASKYTSDSSKKYFLPQNGFAGPSIQRVSYTTDSFYVHAHAEYWDTVPATPLQIDIYYTWPSLGGVWYSGSATFFPDNGSHSGGWIWGDTLSTNPIDTELYFVAVQNTTDAITDQYVDIPLSIMSHTSGIIAKVTGPPMVSVQPTTINFGDVLVGQCSDDTTVEILSTGKSALGVNSATLTGPDASQFKIVNSPLPQTVSPGGSLPIMIEFCPDSVKCPNATLSINTAAGTETVALSGCGVQPQMVIRPLAFDFGRVHIGQCKDSFIIVSNPGKDPLTISRESIVDPRFKVLDNLPIIVAAGDSTKLNLEFCPTDTIIWHAIDSVIGDAPQSPVLVILNGEGKIGILSLPKEIDFGEVREGTCKDSIFYAKNIGNDSLIIQSGLVSISGFTPVSPVLPDTLFPNDSIAIDIRFCATDTGSFQAIMTAGTDIPSLDSVTLLAHSGIGILQMATTIDFDSVAIGGCKDTTVPVKNIGTDTLVLAPGANFQPPFSYQGSSPIVLAPGEVSSITLRFCPQDTNEATETTHFDTIGAGTNQIFTLRGKGLEGTLSTSGPIDLGCIVQGSSVTRTNIITNGPSAKQNFVVTPSGSVTIVHSPPSSLSPGEIDSIVIIIPTSTLGAFSATLTLTWTNNTTPVTVPITAQISVPPAITSLDSTTMFDSTNVGDTSAMKCIEITNYSCIPIPLNNIFVSGGIAGEFEIDSNTASTSIADSETATICLRYSPLHNGSSSATLFAMSGSMLIPLSQLSGTGIGKGVGVELAVDTIAGRPGQIVNMPVRTLNNITAASIDTVIFRVSFNPMQLDLKSPAAPLVPSIESNVTATYSVKTYSIGDKEITAAFSSPLTGTPIIAELPFEILQPTANTALVRLDSASFSPSLATLSSTTDGLIQIEQCDTNDKVTIVPTPIDVAQNNPNPFAPRSTVTVTVNTAGHLHLEVYNALGVKVMVPFDGDVTVGTQLIELDASALASGAYRYITTWTWNGSTVASYQPTIVRDEKTMIVLGE